MITDEQLQALLGMQDISELEEQRGLTAALGRGLRQSGLVSRGKDTGSNIARAAYGIGGALGDYQALKAGPGITGAKQDLFARLLRKKPLQAPEKEYMYEDIY